MMKKPLSIILLVLVIVLIVQVSYLNKRVQSLEMNVNERIQRIEALSTRWEEALNTAEEKGQEIAEEWIDTSAPLMEDRTITAKIRVLFKEFSQDTKAYLLIDGDALEMTRDEDGFFTISLPIKFYEKKQYAYRLDDGDRSRIINKDNPIASREFEIFADTLYSDLGNRINYSATKGLFSLDGLSLNFPPTQKFYPEQEFTAFHIFLEQGDNTVPVYTLNKEELKALNENTLELKEQKVKEDMTKPWKLIVEIEDNYGLSYRLIYDRIQSGNNIPEGVMDFEIVDGENHISYF